MLKTLLAQIKEYKKDTILTPVLVVVEVILEVVIPLLMAMIIDKGIEVRDMNMVVKLGIITSVSYTHLDVYKRQVSMYLL